MATRLEDQFPSIDKFGEQILGALYEMHPKGCGYNQLVFKAKVNKRVLDLRLKKVLNEKSLVRRGYVHVEKGRTPRSPWNITLTENGRKAYLAHFGGKVEGAFRLITELREDKMCEALRKTMGKVFGEMFKIKGNLADLKRLDIFLKALEAPYMDVANKPLRNTGRRDVGLPYFNARFTLDRLQWWWIRDDALLALEKGHWISPGRILLLTTLGIKTELFLSRHNKKWQNRVEQLGKDSDAEKDLEHELREPIMKERHPEAFCTVKQTMWKDLKYF
jgi:hypothetical protein